MVLRLQPGFCRQHGSTLLHTSDLTFDSSATAQDPQLYGPVSRQGRHHGPLISQRGRIMALLRTYLWPWWWAKAKVGAAACGTGDAIR